MNVKNAFILSLMAMSTSASLARATTVARDGSGEAFVQQQNDALEFAPTLMDKIGEMIARPKDPFGQVWSRTDFVEAQPHGISVASSVDPRDVFARIA